MGFVNEIEKLGEERTFDKERNAWIVHEKNIPGGINEFSLHWQDAVIRFSAFPRFTKNDDKTENIHWDFFYLRISPDLKAQEAEIIEIIREALVAHGMDYSHQYLKNVSAAIGDPPEI